MEPVGSWEGMRSPWDFRAQSSVTVMEGIGMAMSLQPSSDQAAVSSCGLM